MPNWLSSLSGLWKASSPPASKGLSKNFGRMAVAILKAFEDEKRNAPRPAAPPMTGAQRSALLAKAEVLLPHVKAWLAAHPGDLTAIDDLLDALTAAGFSWASALKAGVDAAPGLIAEANEWLPALKFLLGEVAPAPIGIPGGWSGARGHV